VLLIVGPSGSGKSTLARAIAGLIPRDIRGEWRGSLQVGGLEVSTASPADVADRVGILFQDPASQLVMDRAADDVAFGLENRRWARDRMLERVPEALRIVGLAGFDERRCTRLSGGEQQRLALAGIEAPRPSVLVLDEPTANLDPEGAVALLDRLAELRRSRAATIVLIEHRADLAWPLADRVLALDSSGRPIALAPPGEILERHGPALARAGIWLPTDTDGASSDSDVAGAGAADSGASGVGARQASNGAAGLPGPSAGPGPAAALGVEAGEPAGGAILAMTAVRYAYGSGIEAIRGIDLDVASGERLVVTGRNGSGKSTLLRLMAGLVRPDAGSVRLAGRDPGRIPARELARTAGYVFQDPELGFLGETVRAELNLGREREPAARSDSEALAERMGLSLERLGDRSPYRLSGGEQRRLSVASALVRRPRVLFLDEPTFGQDRRGWEALIEILHEVVSDGTTVIAATHDLRFARRAFARHVVLEAGRIAVPAA
jgi:energy-coupling factor transport system ATP-binding protein